MIALHLNYMGREGECSGNNTNRHCDQSFLCFSLGGCFNHSLLLPYWLPLSRAFYPTVWKGWCLNEEWCEQWKQWKLAGLLLLKFLVSNKGRVLTEILLAVRQESLSPSSSSPFWSSPITISFSCVVLCSLTFSFPLFLQRPDHPGTNFPQRQQQSAANSMLISCFLFLLEPFHLSLSLTSCVWSGLVGHSHLASPIHLFHTTFAVMTLLQDLQCHKNREIIWAANPLNCMTSYSWPHTTVAIGVLEAGNEFRRTQGTPLPSGRWVEGAAEGATRLGLNLELRLPDLFCLLPAAKVLFCSIFFIGTWFYLCHQHSFDT